MSAADVYAELGKCVSQQTLSFIASQAPEKILAAYDTIGRPAIFDSVSDMWPGPRTTPDDIKRWLANYVKRRNQIAHEGDQEASGAVRHMQPKYANDCGQVRDLLDFLTWVSSFEDFARGRPWPRIPDRALV